MGRAQWIDLPIIEREEPVHKRVVVAREPGLYFVGLHFLYAFSSSMIHGVSRDAEHVVDAIVSRTRPARLASEGLRALQPA